MILFYQEVDIYISGFLIIRLWLTDLQVRKKAIDWLKANNLKGKGYTLYAYKKEEM